MSNHNLSEAQFGDDLTPGMKPGQEGFMPAHEFAAKFPPAYYSDSWKNVPKTRDFKRGGDNGDVDMEELTQSLKEQGMHTPVQIENDEVTEGHHRVVAALRANVPVRFQRW